VIVLRNFNSFDGKIKILVHVEILCLNEDFLEKRRSRLWQTIL
jgi:hypothetical protein